MRRFFCTILFMAGLVPAIAQQAPVQQDPAAAMSPAKLTIRECLGLLSALNSLDGQRVIVAKGKPTESVETVPYKLGSSQDRAGKVRGAISHNIFMLGQIQQEAQAANRRAMASIGKGTEIRPGSSEAIEFDRQMAEYTERPCNVELDHIQEADLRLDQNDIPGSVLALLWRVIDR
jgi:hypothetical protein